MISFRFVLLSLFGFISNSLLAQKDSIDLFIEAQMKQQRIEGLSVGIVQNGKVFKAKGYGLANIEQNIAASITTVYKIGSLSKQFVAAGIMSLVDDGKIKVSDPMSKYVKNVPESWQGITIRDLLRHQSGLPVDPPDFDGMKEIPDSVYLRSAFKIKLNFSPGSKYEYSNFGYFVLAEIIRIVSKMSFPDFMRSTLFAQSGMTATRTTSHSAIIPNRAGGYIRKQDSLVMNAPDWLAIRPSGAFLSDIQDMLKWEKVMQDRRLLTNESWSRVWNDTTRTPYTMDNEPMYYAYGWMTNRQNTGQLVHHAGSLPGFKSVYLRYLSNNNAIIILCNSDDADVYAIAFGVGDLLDKR